MIRPRDVLFSAALVGVAFTTVPSVAHAQKLVLLVRHAERADGGPAAGAMLSSADPGLSDAGKTRADHLAALLRDAGLTAIISTELRRTQETAAPLADRLKLPVVVIPGADTMALHAKLKADHADGIVLVVGHSNTIPAIVQRLGGPAIRIAENEYDKLLVLVPSTGALTTLRYE